MADFIADDFASIARGLKLLEDGLDPSKVDKPVHRQWYCRNCDEVLGEDNVEEQRKRGGVPYHRCIGCQRVVHPNCEECGNEGWQWRQRSGDYHVCSDCGNPAGLGQP